MNFEEPRPPEVNDVFSLGFATEVGYLMCASLITSLVFRYAPPAPRPRSHVDYKVASKCPKDIVVIMLMQLVIS
jgi:hypothetical protein